MKRSTFSSIAASSTQSQENREVTAALRAAEFASDSSVPWKKLPPSCKVEFYSNGYRVLNSRGRELFRRVQAVAQ